MMSGVRLNDERRPPENINLTSPEARADTEAAPALVDRLASTRPRAMPTGVASAKAAITVQYRVLVAPASPSMGQSPALLSAKQAIKLYVNLSRQ
jgi:hypothetical protein